MSAALATFQDGDRSRVQLAVRDPVPPVHVPLEAASRALRTLVKNAIEASPNGTPVHLAVAADDGMVRFAVVDRGTGMRPPTCSSVPGSRSSPPRPPAPATASACSSSARSSIDGAADSTWSSKPGQGTSATLELPVLRCGAVMNTDPARSCWSRTTTRSPGG